MDRGTERGRQHLMMHPRTFNDSTPFQCGFDVDMKATNTLPKITRDSLRLPDAQSNPFPPFVKDQYLLRTPDNPSMTTLLPEANKMTALPEFRIFENPLASTKLSPDVEVTHYPIVPSINHVDVGDSHASTHGHSGCISYHTNPAVSPQLLSIDHGVDSECRCACHHTHHHHHHHTIVINGSPTAKQDVVPCQEVVAMSHSSHSPRLGVLKTISCPPWADGAPKAGRPIRNYNSNNSTRCEWESVENPKDVRSNYVPIGHLNTNNNGTGSPAYENDVHIAKYHVGQQATECEYQVTVQQKKKVHCWKLTKGMTIVLVTMLLIIFSLLAGLVYFLAGGNSSPSDSSTDHQSGSSGIPEITTVINQTTVCGIFPLEYLPLSSRSPNHFRDPPFNPYAPENDSRIVQSPRIIGGKPTNIVQYPWQDLQSITTSSVPSAVDASMVMGRIYGGRDSSATRFPWQVRLRAVSLWVAGKGMTCGGSIIMRNWVLTAAHCTEANWEANAWTAYMGMSSITEKSDPPAQSSKILKIIQHELYVDDWSYDYDISLMKLATPVTFTPSVQPICLPAATDVFKEGTPRCYISGWGAIDNSGTSGSPKILQHAQVDIIGYETCRRDDWLSDLVTDRMMCAGKVNGSVDACQGDSGGPLSCYNSTRKVWTLAGSVSWGIDCGKPRQPGVYTKIPVFVDWIWTNIGKSEGLIPTVDSVSVIEASGETM